MDNGPLSNDELDRLVLLVETKNPDGVLTDGSARLHGFLTSVVSGPMVMPSEWLPLVFGGDEAAHWVDLDQASEAMALVMRFYNEILSDLSDDDGKRYTVIVDSIGEPPDTVDYAGGWCTGYLYGFALRDAEWKEALGDEELIESFDPILKAAEIDFDDLIVSSEYERYTDLISILPNCAYEIYSWWQGYLATPVTVRRETPKISVNAPCPCGSGKKYKRCCSALRLV
jgi:uncharacterized protein